MRIALFDVLNAAQKRAVEATEGPIMVIAGPGTGKTQLLASRVVNILEKNSTLSPSNILCLTFTEAGQIAMQRRLIELMGESGAHVAVHTFHSFGAEIINNHPDYFFNTVQYSPADELSTHEILIDVLDNLPLRHPLAVQHQGEYALIGAIKRRIQEFKKAINPEELAIVVNDGLVFIDYIEPKIIETFGSAGTFTKQQLPHVANLLEYALKYNPKNQSTVRTIKQLHTVFTESLTSAYATALEEANTKPITSWKKDWFTKDENKLPICKQRSILEKLAELAVVYRAYQDELQKRRLFDFDDMVMQVVQSLESRGDLAYELQEQYQYYLVDEFQDTNVVQMRLLRALVEHPVHEGSPNVMVVGDDDQAVFAFQGAELSNILSFTSSYTNALQVTLSENYRSSSDILQIARAIITQGKDRLENYVNGIDKTLAANATFNQQTRVERLLFDLQTYEYEYIAKRIAKQIKAAVDPAQIAVIAREHKQLEALLPYLFDEGVPVAYERRQNALQNSKVKELLTLAKVVYFLSNDSPNKANELFPELLSADYWQLPAIDIWQISLARHHVKSESDKLWLNGMLSGNAQQKAIATFLLEAAKYAHGNSLESVLDVLIGNSDSFIADTTDTEPTENHNQYKPISPFKSYYFSDDILSKQPDAYIELLTALTALRSALRSYKPDKTHTLGDLIAFCELAERAKVAIPVKGLYATGSKPVQLLTAHKSKGLEFDTVYLLSATQSIWNSKGKGGGITLSPNLLSIAHTLKPDDNIRLFYVAMTRAKRQLFISSFATDDSGKEMLPFVPLEDPSVRALLPAPEASVQLNDDATDRLLRAERHWHDKHLTTPSAQLHDLLQNRLENYALSATHLNNFLDIPNGGPNKFFLHNLLQFPAAMSPSASFGSAMHATLEYLHSYYIKHTCLPDLPEAENYFQSSLQRKGLIQLDYQRYVRQGSISLQKLYQLRKDSFTTSQLPEQDFRRQGVVVNGANLTGKLDVLETIKRSVRVIDYKTGKSSSSWELKGKTAYEKEKLHRYMQQLYFYKLLVDGSRSWGEQGVTAKTGELVFVEPNAKGNLDVLSLDLTDKHELERLRLLIGAVWRCIMQLEFPDISIYSADLKGILAFEDWLIANK